MKLIVASIFSVVALVAQGNNQQDYYAMGRKAFNEKSYEQAFKYFNWSAEKANTNAWHWIGVCYCLGQGVEKDDEKSLKWESMAALMGVVDAQENTAMAFYDGRGIMPDVVEAYAWMYIAAKSGNSSSKTGLKFLNARISPIQRKEAIAHSREIQNMITKTKLLKPTRMNVPIPNPSR